VLKTPCHIVSDLHLGVASAVTERLFESYLAAIAGQVRTLVINGDLFDFWFEWKTVIPRRGFRTLAALAALHDSGTKILYIAGNHDCWGGEVLRADVGVEYSVGPWEGSIGAWRTRVEHGDGLRKTEDRRYRMVRPIMRSAVATRLFRGLHPDWATRLATGSSNASRTYAARDGGAGLRAIGHARLASDPTLDLLIYGHSHVAALERVGTAQVFANAGSWLDSPTYLEMTDESISLLRWTGSAERDSLNAIYR
jgi:UDP-2,3-diacylglucosamine hydrolase